MAENFATSLLATALRGTSGVACEPAAVQPEQMLQLYDMENCPYCRLVREVLTELNLDAEIYPCPKSGERYRPEVEERGGKAQFPYLVDPNTGVEMYESLDIITYLYETYAKRPLPLHWRSGRLQQVGSMLAGAARFNRGMQAKPGREPEYLLELYTFESSPYARPVKELLCEMELPYILRSCGRTDIQDWILPKIRDALQIEHKSLLQNRRELQLKEGRVSIPYLYDPNNEIGLFESDQILEYLQAYYS